MEREYPVLSPITGLFYLCYNYVKGVINMAKIKVKTIYKGIVNYDHELYEEGSELTIDDKFYDEKLFTKVSKESKKKEEE